VPERTFGDAVKEAADGVLSSFRTEGNFRVQLVLGAMAVVLAAILRFHPLQWAVIMLAIGFVLSDELSNTALEHLVDLVQAEQHDLARAVKHAAAAGVLVAALASLAAGIWLFGSALGLF